MIMWSCREVNEQLEVPQGLSYWREKQFHFHILICKRCRRVKDQFLIMELQISQIFNTALLNKKDQKCIEAILEQVSKNK